MLDLLERIKLPQPHLQIGVHLLQIYCKGYAAPTNTVPVFLVYLFSPLLSTLPYFILLISPSLFIFYWPTFYSNCSRRIAHPSLSFTLSCCWSPQIPVKVRPQHCANDCCIMRRLKVNSLTVTMWDLRSVLLSHAFHLVLPPLFLYTLLFDDANQQATLFLNS